MGHFIKKALSCENRTRQMLVQTTHFQRAVTLLSLMRTPHPSLILEKCLHCKYTFPGSAQPLGRELQHIPPDGFSAHPVLCTGGSFSAAMGFPPQFPHFFCHADASVYAYSLRHCVFKSHYTCFYKKNQVLLKIFS